MGLWCARMLEKDIYIYSMARAEGECYWVCRGSFQRIHTFHIMISSCCSNAWNRVAKTEFTMSVEKTLPNHYPIKMLEKG